MPLIPHPFVNVETVRAKGARINGAPMIVGVRQPFESNIVERSRAAADEDRCTIDKKAVDKVCFEERRRRLSATFDQKVIGGQGGDFLG